MKRVPLLCTPGHLRWTTHDTPAATKEEDTHKYGQAISKVYPQLGAMKSLDASEYQTQQLGVRPKGDSGNEKS
jgi:hypothetical protein